METTLKVMTEPKDLFILQTVTGQAFQSSRGVARLKCIHLWFLCMKRRTSGQRPVIAKCSRDDELDHSFCSI